MKSLKKFVVSESRLQNIREFRAARKPELYSNLPFELVANTEEFYPTSLFQWFFVFLSSVAKRYILLKNFIGFP